jgi:hypothetical protein
MNQVQMDNATINDIMVRYPNRYPYEVVKYVFERDHFKILFPLSFVHVYNGESYLINRSDFREMYRPLFCDIVGQENENNTFQKTRFIDYWFKDTFKKYYYTLNFYPPPLVCPENEYNMWNGFSIDKVDCESSENVQPFINHVDILVNHNTEHANLFIKWLAQIIQEPGVTTRKAVILSSQEGAGKNIFIQCFAKMIGRQYINETVNPMQTLFSTFSNGRVNKLIVNIDRLMFSEQLERAITSPTIIYKKKNFVPIIVNNCNRFILTTNDDIPISLQDHKAFMNFTCSSEKIGDSVYFKSFVEYMEVPSNQKAIVEYLRNVQL